MINQKYRDLLYFFLFLIWIAALHWLGFQSKPIFRDFQIVFEGGHRMALGQMPYRDFFLPMGPITFMIQAFFNVIFGNTLNALMVHSGVLALSLCGLFYGLIRRCGGQLAWASFLSTAFYFSYNGSCIFPFYAISEPYFFLFLAIFLLLFETTLSLKKFPNWILYALVSITCLAFYTRQDMGLMLVGTLPLYFFFARQLSYKPILRYIGLTLGLSFAIGLYFQTQGDFLTLFSLFQPHQASNLSMLSVSHLLLNWRIPAMGLALYFMFKTTGAQRYRWGLLIALNLPILICAQLTVFFKVLLTEGVPVSIFILSMQLAPSVQKKALKTLLLATLIGFTLWQSRLCIIGGEYLGRSIPSLGKMLHYPPHTRISTGPMKNLMITPSALAGLNRVRTLIQQHSTEFINLTEFQFLYAEFGVEPPKGFPIAFDYGKFFYEPHYQRMLGYIKQKKPKLILLQQHTGHTIAGFQERIIQDIELMGYQKLEEIPAASTQKIFAFELKL